VTGRFVIQRGKHKTRATRLPQSALQLTDLSSTENSLPFP